VLGSKALAVMSGKAHVSFADVAAMAPSAMRHRIIRSFEGEAEGVTTDAVVEALLKAVPARPAGVEGAVAEARAR